MTTNQLDPRASVSKLALTTLRARNYGFGLAVAVCRQWA
jgi:hypothetical protein